MPKILKSGSKILADYPNIPNSIIVEANIPAVRVTSAT